MTAVVFAYSNVGDRCLRALHARGVDVKLVITHRDRASEVLWFARVADTAAELGLPVVYIEDQGDAALLSRVKELGPDLIFSFYFRSMLPMDVLDVARIGAFNMHGSLLPAYRGRAPTNWAVLRGETETGATLHEMVAKADAGDIIDQCAVPILPDDTAEQVFDKVSVAAEIVICRSVASLLDGSFARRRNDISLGNYCGARKPEDGRIDWSKPARDVYNLIRAVAPPYPGAFTDVGGTRLIVAEARLHNAGRTEASRASGLRVVDDRIEAGCGDGGVITVRRLTMVDGGLVDASKLASLLSAN